MDPEYVTEQINSHILELQKIFQPFTSVDTALSGSCKRFPTMNKRFWLTSIQEFI